MSRKRERMRMVAAMAVALGLGSLTLQAQTVGGEAGEGAPLQAGPRAPGRGLELALENAEALELTGEQVARLEELKQVLDEDVAPVVEEMRTLRQEIGTDDMDRREGVRSMQELRGRLLMASAPLRGRVQEILTVEQHRELLALMWRNRPVGARPGALGGRGRALQGRPGALSQGRGSFRGGPGGLGARPGILRGGPGFFQGRPGCFRGRPGSFRGGRGSFGGGGRGSFRGGPGPWGASPSDSIGSR